LGLSGRSFSGVMATQIFFYFSYIWGNVPYFSDGLVQPPTSSLFFYHWTTGQVFSLDHNEFTVALHVDVPVELRKGQTEKPTKLAVPEKPIVKMSRKENPKRWWYKNWEI